MRYLPLILLLLFPGSVFADMQAVWDESATCVNGEAAGTEKCSAVKNYELELDGTSTLLSATTLNFLLTGLADGDHTLRVRAINGWGPGGWTDPLVFSKSVPGAVPGLRIEPVN